MNLITSLLRSVYAMLRALVHCYAPFSPFGLRHRTLGTSSVYMCLAAHRHRAVWCMQACRVQQWLFYSQGYTYNGVLKLTAGLAGIYSQGFQSHLSDGLQWVNLPCSLSEETAKPSVLKALHCIAARYMFQYIVLHGVWFQEVNTHKEQKKVSRIVPSPADRSCVQLVLRCCARLEDDRKTLQHPS